MPMKSQAQRGAMFSAKAGKSTLGIPKSVGAKFVKHDQGGKLPKRKKFEEGGEVDDASERIEDDKELHTLMDIAEEASRGGYAKGGPVKKRRK